MKPTATRLLVRVIPEEIQVPEPNEKKDGALPLPTIKGNTVLTAEVLDVGPLTKEIRRGNHIIFSPYGFDEVVLGGEKLVIIQEEMVLAHDNKTKNTGAKR